MRITYKVIGVSRVKQMMLGKRRNIRRDLAQLIQETDIEVVNLAKGFAPVLTGRLRDSIRVLYYSAKDLESEVGTDVFYGWFQEHGTIHHPAHPFMQPATDIARPRFNRRVDQAIKNLYK